jgi:DNA-binding YbaB/EbfC family protein
LFSGHSLFEIRITNDRFNQSRIETYVYQEVGNMAKGFNRPKGMGGAGGGMMSQLKKLQEQMEQTQAQLAEETVTATVGGGVMKITMTGDQRCKSIVIDPDLLKDADAEMLQDMLLSAVNMALDQSRKLAEDRMGPLAGGLGGMGLPF